MYFRLFNKNKSIKTNTLHIKQTSAMQDKTIDAKLLKTRPHFEILNGMRGLAALVIVVFHFMEIIIHDFNELFIAHGFLAVDFFFVLSGFVISYAYDNRIANMKLKTFIKLRLIRLHPLVVVGSILGLLTFLFDPYVNLYSVYGFGETAMLFITSLFMIPYPVVAERYFNLFNFNAPSWSLFWIYVANLVYALGLFKASKKVLTVLAAIGAVALFYIGAQHENLLGGWNDTTFLHGFARIGFSFSIGMLLQRSGWIIKNKLGLLEMCGLLLLTFLIPYNDQWSGIVEPIIVVFIFPLLVSLGAGATLSSKHYKINKFSGDIAYPLFMTHYPFMWTFANYVVAKDPTTTKLAWLIPVLTVLLVALAYVVSEAIDRPIRHRLRTALNKKAS